MRHWVPFSFSAFDQYFVYRNLRLNNSPLRTKALQRTTTLTLPASSSIGGGAIIASGSLARSDTAEAVVKLPYMRRSIVFSNNQKKCSLSCRDRMMLKRCIDASRVVLAARAGASTA
jgi:hypothetical protein